MRKILCFVIFVCFVVSTLPGCYWFIDARAKRAVSIVDAEVTVACQQMTDAAKTTPEGQSLIRIKPALDNLNAYVWGREPAKEVGSKQKSEVRSQRSVPRPAGLCPFRPLRLCKRKDLA